MKPIHIIGAGLAGLSLGNRLRQHGIPVTVHEAGLIPRHRVCGEFICGRGAEALRRMGLESALEGALPHRNIHWYRSESCILKSELPTPAYGLSRHELDDRLAKSLRAAGGELREQSRWTEADDREGVICCSGRQPARSDWIGLKLHCTALETNADLELHLGDHGYLGLSAVEAGRVNVCGLFKKRAGLKCRREDWLATYLDACGLKSVRARIQRGGVDPKSHAAVAGIVFSQAPRLQNDRLALGDAYSAIPPFTGNGMSIALESAEIAAPHVIAYANGHAQWSTVVQQIQQACHARFRRRLTVARHIHPWITQPGKQQVLAQLCRLRLLPFRRLYAATH